MPGKTSLSKRRFYLAVTSLTHAIYVIAPPSLGPGNGPGQVTTNKREKRWTLGYCYSQSYCLVFVKRSWPQPTPAPSKSNLRDVPNSSGGGRISCGRPTAGAGRLCDYGSRERTSRNRRSGYELRGCLIDRSPAQPTDLSQIGINLVTPDGTGDINNYTVIYLTNNEDLARRFQIAGLPAVFDPQLTYEYTADLTGLAGELYVTAAGEELPAYFLFGTETEPPPNSQQSFLANWWFTGPEGRMKQSTLFPAISFGRAAVSLYTSSASLLGTLIGGNTDGNFSILSVRGVYPGATMTVSVSRQH